MSYGVLDTIVFSFILSFILLQLVKLITGFTISNLKSIFYIVILGILTSGTSLLDSKYEPFRSISTILICIILTWIFLINNSGGFNKTTIISTLKFSVISVGIMFVGIGIIQTLIYLLLKYIYGNDIVKIISSSARLGTVVNIADAVISTILIAIFKHKNFKLHHSKYDIISLINTVVNLTLIVVVSMFLFQYINIIYANLILILVIIMVFYFAFNLFTTKFINKLYIKNMEKEQLEIDIQTIKDVEMEMSKLRHNHLNSLLELKEYINNTDLDGLKKAYSEIIQDYDNCKNNYLTSIIKIKNLSVRSIISSKLSEMEKHGINIHFEVSDYIDEINMNNHDLCQVLGIYIDNAIEASKESEDKSIDIVIISDKEYISFIINNSCDKEVDINRVNDQGFSTKGKNRGNGLYISKNIIAKYCNVEKNTYIDKGKFVQELFIKKRG